MERSQLDFILERSIAALLLATLAIGPLCTGLVRPEDFVYAIWLTAAAVVLWILRILCCKDHRVLWPPICHGVVAFMLYAVWSYFQAPIEYVARQELIRVLVYGAVFLVFMSNLHRQSLSQAAAMVLITVAMGISLYAVFQMVTGSDRVWGFIRPSAYHGRGSGTYINPNHLAGFLGMILPMAVALTLSGRFGVVVKILLGYAALAILVGSVVTLSRGGWVAGLSGLGFMFGFWLWQSQDRRLPAVLIGALMLMVATGAFFYARQSDARQQRLSQVRVFADVRYKLWPAAVSIWKDHPWFGGGPAHFDHRFPKYRLASDQLAGRPERAHNDYLNTLADWGVVGTGLILGTLAFMAWGFFGGWKYLQRSGSDLNTSRSSTRAALALGGFSGVLAVGAHSLFDFNMHIPANAITAICLMAIVSATQRYASDRYWLPGSMAWRVACCLPLAGWVAFVGPESVSLAAESRELSRVRSIRVASQERLQHLNAAAAADPANPRTAFEIGEHYWRVASEGAEENAKAATTALEWFQHASRLNPFDPQAQLRQGMCLDWLGRHEEARPKFEQALALDPNGFNTVGHMGWHFFQVDNLVEARKWLEKSQGLYPKENPLAYTYLRLIENKEAALREKARQEAADRDEP